MARRWGPWLALGLLVVAVVAVAAWPSGGGSDAARIRALEHEFKCPECQGLSVADSEAPTSKAIRTDIRTRVAAGQSDARIRQAYIDRYGESILLKPQQDGLGLIVWVLPVLALGLGATGIAFAMQRARREPRLHPTDADEDLVARARR